mgnify:CR=1 FL=1
MHSSKHLWEKICSEENFYNAWQKVKANRGCPGIDKVTIEDFELNLHNNLSLLRNLLKERVYEPLPSIVKEIKKENGKKRVLKIPAVRDRIVQEAVLLILQPFFEQIFLECSYGYRVGKSALMAVKKVENLIRDGFIWIIDADIKEFFESVSKRLIIYLFSSYIDDKRIVNLLKGWLEYETQPDSGIPQGMVLSPLLANLYLHNFDLFIKPKSKGYIRYCDDFVVLCRSKEEAEKLFKIIDEFFTNELLLSLNHDKSRISNVSEGFTFLGFDISKAGRKPSTKSIDRLKTRIKDELLHSYRTTEEQLKNKIKAIIRGWQNYFGLSGFSEEELLKEVEELSNKYHDPIPLRILKAALYIQNNEQHRAYDIIVQHPVDTEEAELHYQWGILCECLGLEEEAVDEYYEALRLDNSHKESIFKIGVNWLKKGKIDRAINFLQKAVYLQPDNFEVYIELAKAYEKWELHGAAQKALLQAKQINPNLSLNFFRNSLNYQEKSNFIDEDLKIFLKLFSGREGVHARQWINEYGKIGYYPVQRALDIEDVRQHINGKITLGMYLMRMDNTIKVAVIDIDLSKKLILNEQTKMIDMWQLVFMDAVKIVRFLQNFEVTAYLESSGWRGVHVWLFFEQPIKARDVRAFLKLALRKVGPPPEGINREIFPIQDAIDKNSLGSLIKLPLGKHKLTDNRCLFIDLNGKPLENQFAFLWSIKTISSNKFYNALSNLNSSQAIQKFDIIETEKIDQMLKKCKVLKYLSQKAKQELYLNHYERLVLLNTLGHIGEEGKKAIHTIISNCTNYSYERTEKWIRRMSKFPLSCPKIRDWLGDITSVVGCYCEFNLGKNEYPSPLLHVGIKTFRKVKEEKNFEKDELIKIYMKLKKEKQEIEKRLHETEKKLKQFGYDVDLDEVQKPDISKTIETTK